LACYCIDIDFRSTHAATKWLQRRSGTPIPIIDLPCIFLIEHVSVVYRWLLTDLSVWSLALTALCVILWSNSRAMIAEYGPDAEKDTGTTLALSGNAHKPGKRVRIVFLSSTLRGDPHRVIIVCI
jgi:hypothetical protein